MKKLFILFLFCFAVLLQAELVPQKQNIKTRGVWLWASTVEAQGSKTIVNKIKDNYINKVYLLVKGGAGKKMSEPLLKEFITEAHLKDIKVQLWYIVAEDNQFILSHPHAHIYHSPRPDTSTVPYPMKDSKVNLLYPGYKEYVLENIKEYLTTFDCDGIHLDVIRYSNLVYSFDKEHLQKAEAMGCNTQRLLKLFNDDYKNCTDRRFIDLYTSGDSDVVKWVTMRKNIIHDYIASIKSLIDSTKPGIELTAAFMPEGATDTAFADVHYSQDYSLNSPLLDEICPMAYFKSFDKYPAWLKIVTEEAMKKVSSNCRISTGYQTFNDVTPNQVKEQIKSSFKGGALGVVAFRYGTTTDEQWKAIKQTLRQDSKAKYKTE